MRSSAWVTKIQLYWGLLLAEQLVAAALLLNISSAVWYTFIWHLPVFDFSCFTCFLGQPNICAFSNANVLAGRSCTLAQENTFHVESFREVYLQTLLVDKSTESTKSTNPRCKDGTFRGEAVELHRGYRPHGDDRMVPWSSTHLAVSIAWHSGLPTCDKQMPTWQPPGNMTTNTADVQNSQMLSEIEWQDVTANSDLQVSSAYDMFQRSNAQIETWLWFARLQGRGKADLQRIFMARLGSGALITASFGLLQWTFLGNTEGNRTGELRFRSTHLTHSNIVVLGTFWTVTNYCSVCHSHSKLKI